MTLHRVTKGTFTSADGKRMYGKGSKVPDVPAAVADYYGMTPVSASASASAKAEVDPAPTTSAATETATATSEDLMALTAAELRELGAKGRTKADLVASLSVSG